MNKATAGSTTNKAENTRLLPKGWRWVKLGAVIAEAQSGFACGERDTNGAIQIRMNNVDTRGNLLLGDFIRVPAEKNTILKYQLTKGDVLFNNTNSTELVGKSALFYGYSEPVVYSNHFTRLRVNKEQLHSGYLVSWLVLQWNKKIFENLCNRWIGQSAVKNDKLLNLEIPLPPLPEQQRIATILKEQIASVEKARKAAEQQLEAAKALPAAYLRSVFNSLEAQKWPKKQFGDVCTINPGQHILEADYNNNQIGIGYLTGPADFGETYPNITKWTEKPKAWCEPGDVLVTVKGAGVGKTNLAPKIRAAIGRQLMAIRPKQDILNQMFLYYVLITHFVLLKNSALGATVPGLGRKNIETLTIPLPPFSAQQHIVTDLFKKMVAVENMRFSIETQLDTINKLPAALLKRAFNGEL